MHGEHVYRIPMPTMALRVALPRAFNLRVKIALSFIRMASWFMPVDMQLEGVRLRKDDRPRTAPPPPADE